MIKVRVLTATIDGNGPGSLISIDERSVDALTKLGYVEVVKEDKPKQDAPKVEASVKEEAVEEVKESAPKATSTTRKTSSKRKDSK